MGATATKERATSADDEVRTATIRRTLEILHPGPNPFFEIRLFSIPGRYKKETAAGYFTDYDLAAKAAIKYDAKKPDGVYVTVNRPDPLLLARAPNQMVDGLGTTTSDDNIARRQWLYIDCDSLHAKGVCATDEQQTYARELVHDVETFLREHGWPAPVCACSGNGYALLYRIDLPNDGPSKDLVNNVLVALHGKCRHDGAKVDTTTGNAARVCRLFGTWNRKGFDLPVTPHRLSELYEPPDRFKIATIEQLQDVAALVPRPEATAPRSSRNGHGKLHVESTRQAAAGRWPEILEAVAGIPADILDGKDHHPCPKCMGKDRFRMVDVEKGACFCNQCFNKKCGDGFAAIDWMLGSSFPKSVELVNSYLGIASYADTLKLENQESAIGQPAPADGTAAEAEHAAKRTIEVIDSKAFIEADYSQRYLVRGVLVADQPAICGGRSKVLKTSLLMDLSLSLGTGTPFLGRFETIKTPVVFLSGESGQFTIQETAKRIATAKEINAADADICWGFDLPQLARMEDMDALVAMVAQYQRAVVIIDPAYLCLLGGDTQGRQASNVFDMGPLLLGLTAVGRQTKSTIILCHHCRKNLTEPWTPPELEDLAMAGFAEWARQWLLVGRREPYEQGTGEHRLWLNIGGSAGHSGCWAVDVREGQLADDFTGRTWQVTIGSQQEVRRQRDTEKQRRRAEQLELKQDEQRRRLADAIKNFPEGETARVLREVVGLNASDFATASSSLLKTQEIEVCQVPKGKRDFPGFRPRETRQ